MRGHQQQRVRPHPCPCHPRLLVRCKGYIRIHPYVQAVEMVEHRPVCLDWTSSPMTRCEYYSSP